MRTEIPPSDQKEEIDEFNILRIEALVKENKRLSQRLEEAEILLKEANEIINNLKSPQDENSKQ